MKSKHSERGKKKFDFNAWLGIVLLITAVVWFSTDLINGQKFKDTMEHGNNKIAIARVVDEKVYMGNSPVSRQFYYKYEFFVGGVKYYGDSRNTHKQPGDTILIKYNEATPDINQSIIKH